MLLWWKFVVVYIIWVGLVVLYVYDWWDDFVGGVYVWYGDRCSRLDGLDVFVEVWFGLSVYVLN